MGRLRKKPWARDELRNYDFTYSYQNVQELKGSWKNRVFGNDNPIYLELGTGKGQFITTLAENNPDKNYIGVEKIADVLVYAARKIDEKELNNIILLEIDAKDLIEIFEQGEVAGIFINFADPWPKNRHAKRRLTHENFLHIYNQILQPDGFIEFKSDSKSLFEFSIEQFTENNFVIKRQSTDLHNSEIIVRATTEYEDKFVSRGKPIYFVEARLKNN